MGRFGAGRVETGVVLLEVPNLEEFSSQLLDHYHYPKSNVVLL